MTDTPTVTVHHGDCINVLRTLPDNSVDAVVTDPPYGLANTTAAQVAETLTHWVSGDRTYIPQGAGFMGKAWDAFVPPAAVWDECYRVLKPGGHMLVFAGTRTHDLMTLGIRLAGFDIRDSLFWAYGSGFPKSLDVSKAIDKAAGAEREVTDSFARTGRSGGILGTATNIIRDITAPATDAARQWDGWGTAIKPAVEPLVHATKPQVEPHILDVIGSHLTRLEAECASVVSLADQSSTPSRAASPEVNRGSALGRAATPHEVAPVSKTATGEAGGSPAATDTSASGSKAGTYSNTVTSWRQCWVELCEVTNTSTTGTTTSSTIDLTTLSSCLSRITLDSTPLNVPEPGWSPSLVAVADNLFAASVLSSRSTRGLSAIESATNKALPASPDGTAAATSPAQEPIVLARKPLAGTVANNVTTWGTGALNIDATRVPGLADSPGTTPPSAGTRTSMSGDLPRLNYTPAAAGRWPSNLVLTHAADCTDICADGCPVAELDRQASDSTRFFPVFRYQAKAPTRERPRAWTAGCNCETVKPWSNMEASQPRDTADSVSDGDKSWNTSTPGSSTTDAPSLTDMTSTTSTTTNSITTSTTSDSSQRSSTSAFTAAARLETESGGSHAVCVSSSSQSTPSTSTSAKRDGRSTAGAAPVTSPKWSATSVCAKCGTPAKSEAHATVKPLDLMRWLARLVTPIGGTLLEPFAGSGTTIEAAMLEGFHVVAVEREADYLPLIDQRIARARAQLNADAAATARAAAAPQQAGLFDDDEVA